MQDDGSTSPVRQFMRNKWVRAILIVDVIAIIAVIGVVIWNRTKSATINFNITPIDAAIQMDGGGEYYNGSYQVHPGTHEITISRDGLTPKSFTLDLQSGYVSTLTTFLSADGNFEFYELKDNYDSFQQLATIASKGNNLTTDHDTSAEPFIANFQQAYDFMQVNLPIQYSQHGEFGYLVEDVTIREGYSCSVTLCIEALMIGVDENFINSLLVEKGFNLEDYEIEYKVY